MSTVATHRFRPAVESLELRLTPDAASYVEGLYLDVLDRPSDPAGLAYWTQQLNTGRLSHAEVAAEFWFSVEHRTQQVTEYYNVFLNRAPDQPGLNHWVEEFRDGESEYEIMEEFLLSAEYVSLHPTANAYVRGLYEDVLGRTPSPQEEAAWVQFLTAEGGDDDEDDEDDEDFDAEDRWENADEVVEGFLTSDEHFLRVIDEYYLDFLHRPADPQGRQAWLNVLRNGDVEDGNVDDDPREILDEDDWSFEKLAVAFLSSPEYIAKH